MSYRRHHTSIREDTIVELEITKAKHIDLEMR